jgi:purine-binding chemotaxis protein CheW
VALLDNDRDEDLERVLRARAVDLAAPLADDIPTAFVDLVIFRIGDGRFALAASEADEAIDIAEVTALPGVPTFYRGLISHRGIVYPLLDIRPFVGRPVEGDTPLQAILFASEERTVAIAADAVESFVRLPVTAIAATSPADEGSRISAIRGLAPGELVVLDVGVLLGDARLVVDDRPTITDHGIRETT